MNYVAPALPALNISVTIRQRCALERIWKHLLPDSTLLGSFPDNHEIKEWTVTALDSRVRTISLVCEVGMTNDEGKLSSLLCRERFHVFITARGAMYSYIRRAEKSKKYRKTSISHYLVKDAPRPRKSSSTLPGA